MDYKLKITQIESAVGSAKKTEKRLKRGMLSTEKLDSVLVRTGSNFVFQVASNIDIVLLIHFPAK